MTPFLLPLTHSCSRHKRICYFLLLVYICTCLPTLSFPWCPFPWLSLGISHSSWPSYLPSFPVMWPACLGLSSGQLPLSSLCTLLVLSAFSFRLQVVCMLLSHQHLLLFCPRVATPTRLPLCIRWLLAQHNNEQESTGAIKGHMPLFPS